jgi:hypothetical protein
MLSSKIGQSIAQANELNDDNKHCMTTSIIVVFVASQEASPCKLI